MVSSRFFHSQFVVFHYFKIIFITYFDVSITKIMSSYNFILEISFDHAICEMRTCSRKLYLFLNVRLQKLQMTVGNAVCCVRICLRRLPLDIRTLQYGHVSANGELFVFW